jgi:hypothetical protein
VEAGESGFRCGLRHPRRARIAQPPRRRPGRAGPKLRSPRVPRRAEVPPPARARRDRAGRN